MSTVTTHNLMGNLRPLINVWNNIFVVMFLILHTIGCPCSRGPSIGTTPRSKLQQVYTLFRLFIREKPPTITRYIRGSSPSELVETYFLDRDEILVQLKLNLIKAQARMKKLVDKHCSELEFAVGDQVFFKIKPYRQDTLCLYQHPKLARHYFGPYQALKGIGQVEYKLDLPTTTRVHPVFSYFIIKVMRWRARKTNYSTKFN